MQWSESQVYGGEWLHGQVVYYYGNYFSLAYHCY